MPHAPRPTSVFPNSNSAGARQTSTSSASSHQSSALTSRIAAKQRELESLKELRHHSGVLAGQMALLEEKLAALSDGTEAVACVLANWDDVLRAISMASMNTPRPTMADSGANTTDKGGNESGEEAKLPVTLVRIPAQPEEKGPTS